MKVIHVVHSLDINSGGPSRSVPQTCEYLSKNEVEIEIYTTPSENTVQLPLSDRFKVTFKTLKQLAREGFKISKNKVDIIHLQHVWHPYVALMCWFARFHGIPYIVTPRGMLEPWILTQKPFKKKIALEIYQKKDLKRASRIHATCELEKNNIQKLGIKTPITIIPNGINVPLLPEPKKEYGTKKIIFLSRIHLKKGIEILLEAWKQIAHRGWVLEIAGNGEESYVASIEQKIKNEKIQNVSLVGAQYDNDKWDFIKSGDVFVLPTFSENFGIVVAEALAMGVPVITTTGTPWEELEQYNCGWWIELTIENVTKALEEAMSKTTGELEQMGDKGKELINQRYDIRSVVKHIKEMYVEILNHKK